VARMGQGRGVYSFFGGGRPEGKRPLGKPRRRWEDINLDIREIGIDRVNWIRLAQGRVHGGLLWTR
jgi:hypothetical protein